MDYVDSSILIYAFAAPEDAVGAVKRAASRKLLIERDLATSTLTPDEVGYKFFKLSPRAGAEIIRLVSATPNLSFIPFFKDDFEDVAALVDSGLAPRDAIHAATAIKAGCKTIYSEDRDFDRVKGLRRKVPWKL